MNWTTKVRKRAASLFLWIGHRLTAGTETWLYYCPKCRGVFRDKKPKEPLVLVVTCPYCHYQSLVGGDIEEPHTLNPNNLEEGVELCEHGCHYATPYGFVPMAGCPIHD